MSTILFIPGLLSDGRVWQPVADSLKHPFAIADVTKDDTIEGMARRLLAEHAGKLILIAHSMGARVAIDMVRQQPNKIAALLLSNTGHIPARPGEPEKRQTLVDLGFTDMHALASRWLPPMLAPGRDTDKALMDDLTDMVVSTGAETHARQINALLTRPDAALTLRATNCPVLFTTATQDSWSPVAQHEEMLAMTPGAKLQVVEGAGHFLPIEKPAEMAAVAGEWLNKLPQSLV